MHLLRLTILMRYRYALILIALAGIMGSPRSVDAQTLAAVLTYPTNLATNADMTLPVQWTSVIG